MKDNKIQLLLKQAIETHQADIKSWKKYIKKQKKDIKMVGTSYTYAQWDADHLAWLQSERQLSKEKLKESKRLLQRYYTYIG